MNPTEEWRPVPSHPHYEVSNLSRWRRKYAAREGFTPPRTSSPVALHGACGVSYVPMSTLVRRAFGEPAEAVVPARTKAPSRLDPYRDLLGSVPDGDVAVMAGITRQRVHQVRSSLGIPAATPIALVVAAGVDRRADLAWISGERLGTVPDAVLAADLGVTYATVRRVREERGIAAPPRAASLFRGSRLDPYLDLMGVIPDVRIAERAGVASATICMYRQRRGIPACPETAKRGRIPTPRSV